MLEPNAVLIAGAKRNRIALVGGVYYLQLPVRAGDQTFEARNMLFGISPVGPFGKHFCFLSGSI